MSTYPVSSATRESISLDEDELSDVEDEVFIRDGRNGFKFAEDRGVKRPLMAPRRKLGKPDLASRLKNRPPCRIMCVPCCYAFAALSLFLGLIMLVIILVSLFPLPLDKFKLWFSSKSSNTEKVSKVLPCRELNVTEIWTYSLPKLTSESTMRALDVNLDGIEDIVFGFGIGEDVFLPEQWFCPMFLGVNPPCQGGLIALDGVTGQPIWQRWLHHAVLTIYCTADLTGDGVFDCVVSGKGGILCAVNGKDGNVIWEFTNNRTTPVIGIYAGSIIPDQDGDNINDIVASHTIQKGQSRLGFLLIISGKTGAELVRVSTPQSKETYFAPQLFTRFNGEKSVLFGTGGQNSPGALYMVGLHDISMKNINPFTIYKDDKKGIISPVVLIDITGDKIEDIVAAMYNSTIVAFDGITFKQLWNFTVPNAETKSAPTPGYFNSDNVTDFLVKYQVGQGFPVYYFSETYIIDGTNGKPIYNQPIIDTGGEQLHGLTVSMENFGNDMYLFWKSDCKNNEQRKETFDFIPGSNYWQKTLADLCKLRFNTTKDVKLYTLNQYQEPPGVLLYTSDNNEVVEYNNSRLPLEDVRQYLKDNPNFDLLFKNPNPNPTPRVDDNVKFKPIYNNQRMKNMKTNKNGSNFRHRDDGQTLLKEFTHNTNQNIRDDAQDLTQYNNGEPEVEEKYDYDQPEWNINPMDLDPALLDQNHYDYDQYSDMERDNLLNKKKILSSNILTNSRDPRSKTSPENLTDFQDYEDTSDTTIDDDFKKTKKKNLSDDLEAITPNDFKNIYAARNRLLHDLNDVPNEILRQTFEKNKALKQALRPRDTRDEKNENEKEIEKKEAKNIELPETLWDLESEKELEDRENGYYRGKRETLKEKFHGIPRITSTGILLKPLTVSKTKDTIDYIFATYWLLPKEGAQVLLEEDVKCIREKMLHSASSKDTYQNLEKSTLQDLFTKMCLEERGIVLKPEVESDPINEDLRKSPYYNQISQLTLGQMTVYRLRLQCKCQIMKSNERCAQILDDQTWSSYMGKLGDGYFRTR